MSDRLTYAVLIACVACCACGLIICLTLASEAMGRGRDPQWRTVYAVSQWSAALFLVVGGALVAVMAAR